MLTAHSYALHYVWLVTASTVAGVMNAMAGGGSFLSFPAMLGMGIAPVQANATNTVALWPGQLTSLATLRGDIRKDLLPMIGIASVIGGIAGAEVLLHTQQKTFFLLIPWLILGGTLLFGISGYVGNWIKSRAAHAHADRKISRFALGCSLFPVCFYIGYFGAGGGFLVMTVLALFGMEEMHALNALKVFATLMSNFCAVLTFIVMRAIVWRYCIISIVFAALGGWIGAHTARRVPGPVLRGFVVITGLVISAYFFWRQA